MHCYYDAFLEARQAAEPLDFDVLFGIEHAYGDGLEVLCYGIDLTFLLNNPDLPQLNIQEFTGKVHEYGGIVVHAHPYRWAGPELQLPLDILDGIEVYNAGNPQDKNLLAQQLADTTGLIQTSGSDLHNITEAKLGTAGIILPKRIHNEKELVAALKRRDHSLIFP